MAEENGKRSPDYNAGYRDGWDDAGDGGVSMAGLVILLSVLLLLAAIIIIAVKAPII